MSGLMRDAFSALSYSPTARGTMTACNASSLIQRMGFSGYRSRTFSRSVLSSFTLTFLTASSIVAGFFSGDAFLSELALPFLAALLLLFFAGFGGDDDDLSVSMSGIDHTDAI